MNEILQANIFFFIASIATICFCILVSIALYHLIKIMKSVRSIIERIEEGSEIIAEDLSNIKSLITQGGIFSRLMSLFFGAAKTPTATRSKRKFTSRNKKTTYGSQEESGDEDR